jgi:hypothetical protein
MSETKFLANLDSALFDMDGNEMPDASDVLVSAKDLRDALSMIISVQEENHEDLTNAPDEDQYKDVANQVRSNTRQLTAAVKVLKTGRKNGRNKLNPHADIVEGDKDEVLEASTNAETDPNADLKTDEDVNDATGIKAGEDPKSEDGKADPKKNKVTINTGKTGHGDNGQKTQDAQVNQSIAKSGDQTGT